MRATISYMIVTATVVFTGCHATGPMSVKTGRASYNIAVQQTNNEQLLLNIVRLRYRDPPYFLEVSSISTTFEFTASASGSASLPESESNTYDLGTGISFSEQPTVSYTPLQGEDFVTELMSPADLNTIILLYNSGWSVERIFRICLQSINDVPNAPTASGPTPDYAPKYERFREVVRILRQLQIQGLMDMGYTPSKDPNNPDVKIRIAEQALESSEVKRLCELLGLEHGRTDYPLTTEAGAGGKDRIAAVPRSLMGSLFYVSQGVEAPPGDERVGRVTVTKDTQGKRFDWRQVVGELMDIHSSEQPPKYPYAAVRYRGNWFYIDDSGLASKSTFSLLMQLFALQAGEIKSTAPVQTLPVGR
jgi:hypothetical protein